MALDAEQALHRQRAREAGRVPGFEGDRLLRGLRRGSVRGMLARRRSLSDSRGAVKRRRSGAAGSGSDRQREREPVVAAIGGADADLTAVALDDATADRQAEAGAVRAALAAATVERLEDALAVLDRDRRTLALDGEPPVGAF